ncbi:MAG: hypothetical protein GY795_44940 [Desulfobacterales bacterium]|nr:hypothetical protein [Desulfobacterales bacterium]
MYRLASDLEKAAASAREGTDFKKILSSMPIFPNLFITAVASGEQSGTFPDSLSDLAKLYQAETEFHTCFSGYWIQR